MESFKKFNYLFVILVLSLCSTTIALSQNAYEEIEVVQGKDPFEQIIFEKRLEERLHRDILSYLGHSKFILKIDANFIKSKRLSSTLIPPGNSGYRPSYQQQPPPKVPKFPQRESFEHIENKTEKRDFLLPGTSVSGKRLEGKGLGSGSRSFGNQFMPAPSPPQTYPAFQGAQSASPVQYRSQVIGYNIEIKKIAATLIIDKAVSDEEVEFIRNLTFKKAHLDPTRGDNLEIVRIDFPTPPTTESINEKYYPYVFFVTVLFLILLFGMLLYLLFKKPNQEEVSRTHTGEIPIQKEEVSPFLQSFSDEVRRKRENEVKLENLKQKIVTYTFESPELSMDIMKKELQSKEGIQRLSLLFKSLGFQLAKNIFKNLHGKDLVVIEKFLLENSDITDEEAVKNIEELYYKLYYSTLLVDKSQKTTPFNFLHKLDDSQIAFLVNDEEPRIKALVFSQLQSDRAACVMKKFPLEQQGEIAYELSRFDSFPLHTFEEVANKLSKKSFSVPSFENITPDGIGLLVNMLDHMDSSEEIKTFPLKRSIAPSK